VRAGPVYINRQQMTQLVSKRSLPPADFASGATAPLPIASLAPSNSRRDGAAVTSAPEHGTARIGDVRVKWAVSTAETVSVLAAVDGDGQMVPWASGVKVQVAGLSDSVNELQEGDVGLDDFFDKLQEELIRRTWSIRILCLFLYCASLFLFARPLAIAPDLIPCVGPMIGDAVGCLVGCGACAAGSTSFLFVTAICWLWFRPAVGVPLLLAAAALAFCTLRLRRRGRRCGGPNCPCRGARGRCCDCGRAAARFCIGGNSADALHLNLQ